MSILRYKHLHSKNNVAILKLPSHVSSLYPVWQNSSQYVDMISIFADLPQFFFENYEIASTYTLRHSSLVLVSGPPKNINEYGNEY